MPQSTSVERSVEKGSKSLGKYTLDTKEELPKSARLDFPSVAWNAFHVSNPARENKK
jgi:hypothetical protein